MLFFNSSISIDLSKLSSNGALYKVFEGFFKHSRNTLFSPDDMVCFIVFLVDVSDL